MQYGFFWYDFFPPSRPPLSYTSSEVRPTLYLQVGNPSSIFRLPKPQVKLLKKTASVKQLYNSVLHAIKTIASSRDDITPELTKTFFENILRTSDESPKLHVTKVKVKDGTEFGRHFCSEVHAVEVTAKVRFFLLSLFQNNFFIIIIHPFDVTFFRLK